MKKPKTPKLVTVSIFTTVTLIFWVFFGLYNILISTPVVDVAPEILAPLDPTLNVSVLNSIPQKVFIEEGEVEDISITTPVSLTGESSPQETEDILETENDDLNSPNPIEDVSTEGV